MPTSRAYTFGIFTLRREERALYRGDTLVPLGERAIDLLFALVENSSQVVSKAELLRRVWPDVEVDDSTLRFHIGTLRKALGDGHSGERYIVNISGRGYCLVADVERFSARGADRQDLPPMLAPSHPLFGRDRVIEELEAMLAERRFVSVVGAGGMGKSSVAFAAARRQAAAYLDGVFVLDVSVIVDAAQLAPTLAHQVGTVYASGGAVEALCRWLQSRKALLVFDNCETHTDACAALAKAFLQQAPQVHLLTTSREALRVPGEWVLGLKPLVCPPWPADTPHRADVLDSPSVQLLLARAGDDGLPLAVEDAQLGAVCELVARLDGMPLALELAAVRLRDMGVDGVLNQLRTQQFLKAHGLENKVDRHRTLEALIDWSYARLSPKERKAFRRLSVCNGAFTLEAAMAVVADHELSDVQVVEAVIGLESKSLLSIEHGPRQVKYRLLDSTRAFAAEKLGVDDEYRMVRIQQCVYLHDVMLRAEADFLCMALPDWMLVYGPVNNDMRANIAWAFGQNGDRVRAVRLVAAAVGFAHHLALAAEYLGYIDRALSALAQLPKLGPDIEVRLRGGLFAHNFLSMGSNEDIRRSQERAQELANLHNNEKFRVQALNERFVQTYFGDGHYHLAADYAETLRHCVAPGAEGDALLERITFQTLHGLGRHEEARPGLELLVKHPRPRQRPRPPYPIDMSVMSRMLLVRIYWLQGRADDALDLVEDIKALAARDVRFALANAYAWAICPLLLWRGEHEAAGRAINEMHRHASQIDLPFAAGWACAYDMAWSHVTGQPRRLVTPAGSEADAMQKGVVSELVGTVAPALAMPVLFERRRQGQTGWCTPEVLRAEGEHALRSGEIEGALGLFAQAIDVARSQGALAWELRAATSAARVHFAEGRPATARATLEPVYLRFTQGLSTADLRAAAAMLSPEAVL